MPFAIPDNAVTRAFQNIGNEWALLTAGDAEHFNTMTIGWGSVGFIWQRPVVTVLVRPPRYTHKFMEEFERFSVSFYDQKYRKALTLLGSQSGRDTDKIGVFCGTNEDVRKEIGLLKVTGFQVKIEAWGTRNPAPGRVIS